ncbi:CaiB/BaiF CoA transferase family protein [Sphingomonas tabacisoli]|uniref:CaiB/BaiF CoA transferase family protein n=1 Tax=Sphingomonas tabacisoli TaxID=2249466 RepID=A0ABW4I1W9_9SPHN
MSAFAGIRIVELAHRVAGEYASKLFADLGAEVIKAEPPGGSQTRALSPFVSGTSVPFLYLNTNKKSVAIDLDNSADRSVLASLIAGADVVLHDHDEAWEQRHGLDPETLAARHPALIHCAVMPFGRGAPANLQQARPLNVMHASGWGYHTPSEADPVRPPLKGAGRFLTDYEAGLEAALAIAAALIARERRGEGRTISVSDVEALISRSDCVLGRMLASEQEPGPERTRFDMGGPGAVFASADGHVFLLMTTGQHWSGMRKLMGEPAWADAFPSDWLEFQCTRERVETFRQHFRAWVSTRAKAEVSEQAQRLKVPLVPVNSAPDLHADPQYAFRRYFRELEGLLYPTVAYRMSATPACLTAPAPKLGADQALPATAGNTVPRGLAPNAIGVAQPRPESAPVSQLRQRGGPLAGVRVLALTKVWAGPYAGKLLALLGAEVIKVESLANLDEMRAYGGESIDSAPYFLSINQEVLSVRVNTKSKEGLRQLRRMVAQSDIVLDNLRPGAMERAGLTYDLLRKIRPDIIQVSIKMYGSEGPLAHQTGYAPSFAALGGLTSLVGYEGETPTGMNIRYGDSTVGATAAFAALAALRHRDRTGEGQFVDVSAVEAISTMAGDSLFAHCATGITPKCDGNAHPEMAPHGCYPCANGEWISIAVADDVEWRALCLVLGIDADLYAAAGQRLAQRVPVDRAVAERTRTHDAADLATALRTVGVPAFRSQSSLDLIGDGRLWSSEFFRFVDDRHGGQRPVMGTGWRMTPGEAAVERGAPALGEHDAYIYRELLGMSAKEYDRLVAEQAIY